MAKFTIPKEEYLHSGHAGCPGCGAALVLRYALKALGPNTVLNVPAGCMAVIGSMWPRHAYGVSMVDHAFECTGAVSSGIKAALEMKGKDDVTVLGMAGDGGTVDIGLQALSGAVDRGTDFIYLMYDNEAYMNTGVQCSGATPAGAWTTTTPQGKKRELDHMVLERKKKIMDMMVANGIVYGATVNIAYPEGFISKMKKAKEIRGPKFIHSISPCTPGWRFDSSKTIEVAQLATQTNIFPLYEVEDGEYKLTKEISDKKKKPVEEYLRVQGRFKHLDEDSVQEFQQMIDEEYEDLLHKIECSQR